MKQRIAIDIGACQGRFIDIALKDGFTVHAFEPNPTLARGLIERYPTVVIHQAAAWNEDSNLPLYYAPDGSVHASSLIRQKTNVGDRSDTVITVNTGVYLRQFDHISVIKIDAEGAEYRIIESILDHYDPTRIDRWLVEDHQRKIPDRRWLEHKEQIIERVKAVNITLEDWN